MTAIFNTELREQFKKECKVINLKYEYPGWTGNEAWALITDLSERDICEKYEIIASMLTPFLILTTQQGEAILEYRRNEEKFIKRTRMYESQFAFEDSETELHHTELCSDENTFTYYTEDLPTLSKLLNTLPSMQKRRVLAHYLSGLSYSEIAAIENTTKKAIWDSVNNALQKMRKAFYN